ncbi:unnamed protein product [Spirodela intermedia]|uniref:Uncharacterized protein n=1 Tax=Spirodela intermedia TaxID=51605 RepID=A0A7I8KAQ7_SPIIN|nr:unnamed protein product [Spirodela intermedia]
MGRRVVSGGCHPVERKNGNFAALWRLSPDGKELDGVQEEACKTKWKIKNEVEEKSLISKKKKREQCEKSRNEDIDNWNILASSCCVDLRMKLPDTRPTSI